MTHQNTENRMPPSRINFAREFISVLDMVSVPAALIGKPGKHKISERRHSVMLLPGFGAHGSSMAPLGYFLSRRGFKTHDWGLGVNRGGRGLIRSLDELSDRWDVDRSRVNGGEGDVPALCDKVAEQAEALSKKENSKIHLVGWSLGGYIAREVARDLPDNIQSVVTMGAPVFGGPKYTSVAPLFRARNVDLNWIEAEVDKRYERPITQPITGIYSKRDGIVGWQAAYDDITPQIVQHEVNVSHFGIGLNGKVWKLVVDALMQADNHIQ